MIQSKVDQDRAFPNASKDVVQSPEKEQPWQPAEGTVNTLEQALFSNICRGEELRGRLIAILSVVAIALFLPLSYQFEDRFAAVFVRTIPRVGITQILVFTAIYGFLASKTFGNLMPF